MINEKMLELAGIIKDPINEKQLEADEIFDFVDKLLKRFGGRYTIPLDQQGEKYTEVMLPSANKAAQLANELKKYHKPKFIELKDKRVVITLEESLSEGKLDYETYHKSFTEAFDEVRELVKKNGFELNPDEVYQEVGTGGRTGRARPSLGKSTSFTLQLYRGGEEAKPKRYIHFSVYGMTGRSGMYELTAYFSGKV